MESLQLPTTGLTVDDLPATSWPRLELVDGGLHVTPAPDPRHQRLVHLIAMALEAGVGAEAVVVPGPNITSGPGTLLIPDVALVSAEAYERVGAFFAPSDVRMVVEVESPSTRLVDRTLKRAKYAEWQLPYCLVDPVGRTVSRFGKPPWDLDESVLG